MWSLGLELKGPLKRAVGVGAKRRKKFNRASTQRSLSFLAFLLLSLTLSAPTVFLFHCPPLWFAEEKNARCISSEFLLLPPGPLSSKAAKNFFPLPEREKSRTMFKSHPACIHRHYISQRAEERKKTSQTHSKKSPFAS